MTNPRTGTGSDGGHPQPESPPTRKPATGSTSTSGGSSTDGGHPQPEGEPTD